MSLNPVVLSSWGVGDACSNLWAGVQCENSSVVGLDLGNTGLRGTLPSQLGSLVGLRSLVLNISSLSGTVPSQLGLLIGLRFLALDNGSLSGTLPPQLGNLTSLSYLNLAQQPCLYGPLISVGSPGTSYPTYGSSLGKWSVPAMCNLTLPAAPPPPPPPMVAAYQNCTCRGWMDNLCVQGYDCVMIYPRESFIIPPNYLPIIYLSI